MKTIINIHQDFQYNPENGFEIIHQCAGLDYTNKLTRLKVIGGWLLCRSCSGSGRMPDNFQNQSMCFIPDPEHKWEIEYKKGKK